uniref:Uncharacterized protein n=3 Tax=Rhodnius TaxID=13248 RepID=T1HGL3_RHOPR
MKFELYEVKKFCFCIPLSIGAKVFGLIQLIVCGLIFAFILRSQISYFKNAGPNEDIETIIYVLQLSDVGLTLQIVVGVYLLIGLYE